MFESFWFSRRRAWQGTGRSRPPQSSQARRPGTRLVLERLEDRTLLTSYTAATVSDLIADINAANKAGGTNTIALTAPTSSPYVLTAVDNTTDGATGLPVISGGGNKVAADNLTIVGNGDTIERSTPSGTPDFRLFDVASGASLTLENLTLQNGLAFGAGVAAEGGAIYNQGTLVLNAATVQGNMAQGSPGVDGCSTLEKHCNLKPIPGGPAAGGGIWSGGSLTLENGTRVQNNQAIGGQGGPYGQFQLGSPGGDGSGGGLDISGGTANLTGVSINNNSALGGPEGSTSGNAYGGGVYVDKATVVLSNDTVDDNQASANGQTSAFEDSYGGGVYMAGGTLNLSGDTMNGNFAGGQPVLQLNPSPSYDSYGGGMYVAAGTVTLCNDIVENNVAIGWAYAQGAGIDISSNAKVYMDASTLAQVISNTSYPGTFPIGTVDNIDGPYTQQNC